MKKSIRARAFAPALSVLSMAFFGSAYAQSSELNSVVVTANKYEEDTQRVPAFVNVITREQIEQARVGTVNEAIMRLGGVIGTPSLFGGNEYSLDLMGFGDTAASNTVIVIDGVPIREGDQSEIRLSGIPISTIERIEIQRGGAGVLYGEGSTAGVINIVTRASAKNSPTKQVGNVVMSLGSQNAREIQGYANYVNDMVDLSFSAQDRRSDGYRVNSRNDQQNGLLSLKHMLTDKTRVGVSFHRDDTYAQTPGSLTLQEYQQNPRAAQAASLANHTYMNVKTDRYAAFVETDIEGYKLRLDAVDRQRHYDSMGVLYGSPTPSIFNSENNFYALSVQKRMDTQILRNTTVLGVESNDWNQDRVYPSQPSWGTVKLASSSKAQYIKNDLDFKGTGTRITAGVRFEKFDRNQLFTGTNTEMHEKVRAWELGVSQKLDQVNSVYARKLQSYRLPNLDELPTPVYVGAWPNSVAVPLVPQFDKTSEFGWKFNDSRLSSSMRVYESEITDEIVYDPDQSGNINLPKTRRSGVDSIARVQINPEVTLSGAYSYRRARFASGVNDGNTLPMAPQNVLTVRGDWRFVPNQTMGFGWTYVDSQFIAGDFSNQKSMPSYRIADARYSYQMKDADVSFVIRNLTDAKYFAYATTTGTYSVYPDPGRTYMMTLRYKF